MGTSKSCIATHPSDMAVAMRVLDATVETVSADGAARAIPIADFHLLPGSTPEVENVLKAGELVTSVTLPPPIGGEHVYRKVRDRASYAFATISIAAVMWKGRSGRFAFGGLAHKPWRVEKADAHYLNGVDAIASAALEGAATTHQNAFKVPLVRRTLAAVLAEA